MKNSFRGVLIAAAAVAAVLCSQAVAAASHVADTVVATCRAFKNLLVDGFMALTTPELGKPEAVPFARAKAFKARIEKRERPVVTGAWRMCPSI